MPASPVKQISIKSFKGLVNRRSAERLEPGDLVEAVNVVIDDGGQVRRRHGYKRLLSGAGIHSIGGSPSCILYRHGTGLYRFDLASGTWELLRNDIATLQRMWYLPLLDRVYYSDGAVTGCVQNGIDRSWGLLPPTGVFVGATSGNLKAGRYHVCLTYQAWDGQVSGACHPQHIDVADVGGVVVTYPSSSDPRVGGINIWMTTPNGSTLFHVVTVRNVAGTFVYRGSATEFYRSLSTANCYPSPPGQLLEFYRGRVYIASGNVVYYSLPNSYELFRIGSDYLPFDSDVTMLAAVQDGLYVATASTVYFLHGSEPPMNILTTLNGGAVYGTQTIGEASRVFDGQMQGRCVIWRGGEGICVGFASGIIRNVTHTRYAFVAADVGSGIAMQQDGVYQYVVTVHGEHGQPSRYGRDAWGENTTPMITVSGG